jgi:hypothetical protein
VERASDSFGILVCKIRNKYDAKAPLKGGRIDRIDRMELTGRRVHHSAGRHREAWGAGEAAALLVILSILSAFL